MSKPTKPHSPPAKACSTPTEKPFEGSNDASSLSPSQTGIPMPDNICGGSECASTISCTGGETHGCMKNGNAVAKNSPSEGPVLGVVVGDSEALAPSSLVSSSPSIGTRPGAQGDPMTNVRRRLEDTEAQSPLGSSPPGLALKGPNGSHFVPYIYLCRCAYACAYSILHYMIHQEMSRLESLRYAEDDAVVPLGGCLALLRQTLDADHEEADSIRRDVQTLQVQAKWLAHQCEMVEQRQKNLAAKAGLPRKK